MEGANQVWKKKKKKNASPGSNQKYKIILKNGRLFLKYYFELRPKTYDQFSKQIIISSQL